MYTDQFNEIKVLQIRAWVNTIQNLRYLEELAREITENDPPKYKDAIATSVVVELKRLERIESELSPEVLSAIKAFVA